MPSHRHHRLAVMVALSALVAAAFLGLGFAHAEHLPWWQGVYCGVADAATVGGNVQPTRPLGYLWSGLACVLAVPLWTASFSLFTSGLVALEARRRERE